MRGPGRLGWPVGVAGLALVVAGIILGVGRGARATDDAMPHGDLALDCGDCHREEQWVPVSRPPVFEHEQTSFALAGAHVGLKCRACHASLVFSHVGSACADCHEDAHRGENGFRCELCHSPQSWTNRLTMTQAHARSRFPLGGAHASVDCRACHRDQPPQEYVHTPTQCVACHAQDYAGTTQPNHAQVGFGQNCQECHSVVGRAWGSAGFVHPAAFPLSGGHKGLACSSCHKDGFSRRSTDCYECHADDYQRAANPNHVASRFPTNCAQCHGSESWRPARIDHSLTRFPLTGRHQQVACERCHPGGRYTGTPTQCNACHEDDFRGTTNPNHVTGNFPRACEVCHTTVGWRPATFDHSATDFPLTGAHQGVTCARCHPGGVYAGTSAACYSCHAADYNGTSNPNHAAAQFPRTCQDCHTTTAWRPASFDHDGRFFPIYSGRHRNRWSSCADCHVNSADYRVFECIFCHPHSDRAETDGHHRDVRNYAYSSQRCYACHPRGQAEDFRVRGIR